MRRIFCITIATTVVAVAGVIVAPQAHAAFAFLPVETYTFAQPTRPQVADLNGDGYPDIVSGSFALAGTDTPVAVMLNDDDGTFTLTTEAACASPGWVAVGSLNNLTDSTPDIITSCSGAVKPQTLLGDGAGGFANPIDSDVPFYAAFGTTLGHFNGSPGGLDLAYASYGYPSGNPFVGTLGEGDGTFSNTNYGAPGPQIGNDMLAANIHGDGKDVPIAIDVNTNFDEVRFYGWEQAVPGGFTAGSTRPTGSRNARSLDVGDVDNDGDLDLMVMSDGDGTATYPATISMLLYDSVGSPPPGFAVGIVPVETETIVSSYGDAALGDFDGDGVLDVALMSNAGSWSSGPNLFSATLAIHAGNGDGTFDAPEIFPVGNNGDTHRIAVGDFDQDGQDDIVVTVLNAARIEMHRSGAVAPDTDPPETTINSGPRRRSGRRSRRSM